MKNMFPIVRFCSCMFGTWMLLWNKKSERYEICYYFLIIQFILFCNFYHLASWLFIRIVTDNTLNSKPQYLILLITYFNNGIMIVNRIVNSRHNANFTNLLHETYGMTVESGRCLLEFWARVFSSVLMASLLQYKYTRYTAASFVDIAKSVTIPVIISMTGDSFMECQYTSTCTALSNEFDAINRRTEEAATRRSFAEVAVEHGRLVRLVRFFNDEYGVPLLLTTFNLLLGQVYSINDAVTVVVNNERLELSYPDFAIIYDSIKWSFYWLRLLWITYRIEGLITRIHLTLKKMLQKNINSYPEHTRKMAFDYLNQLLHRHVKISAWGFYDVNKELLIMVLGYQFGLSVIFTQFSTSNGVNLMNNQTSNQNYTFKSQQKFIKNK